MTKIRLVYDPFEKRTQIYNEDEEITAAENRIGSFLQTHSFYDCLLPFRKKYLLWEGLLLELAEEAGDGQLQIVFEGCKKDYEMVREAFCQVQPAVEEAGYELKWELVHVRRFEKEDLLEKLLDNAENLREMCESRKELEEIDRLISFRKKAVNASRVRELAGAADACRICEALLSVVTKHIEKWGMSNYTYRQEKITCLKMIESSLLQTGKLFEQL